MDNTETTNLSEEERNALRGASTVEEEPQAKPEERAASVKVVEYNFRQPGQLSSTQLRALNTVHEFFAKSVQNNRVGDVDVSLARLSVETLSYSSFIAAQSNPCFIVQLAYGGSDVALIDIDVPVARGLTSTLLGDLGGADSGEVPALTSIEQSIAAGWIEKLLPVLSDSWSMSQKVDFALRTIETDPRFIQVMPDETAVVVMAFRIQTGGIQGRFSICYPLEPLQPMLEGLSLRMTGSNDSAAEEASSQDKLLASLKKIPFEMRAEIGQSSLLASQLLRLKVGDVICLDRSIYEPAVDLYLESNRVFKARLGRKGDQLAVQVAGRYTDED